MPSLLEANGLTKHYGSVIALDGINLSIGKASPACLGRTAPARAQRSSCFSA